MPALTSDGRDIVMTSLFPAGVYLSFAGAGDSAAGRGQDTPFEISTTVAGTQNATFGFNDYVYLSGGGATWDNALLGDSLSFNVTAPATSVKPNATGTGAVNIAGNGLITPANGTGAFDVTNAVPVPHTDPTTPGAWVWATSAYTVGSPWTPNLNIAPMPSTGLGQTIPTPQGYDTALNWTYDLWAGAAPLASFITRLSIYGTRQATFTLPAIKPQLVLPQWKVTASIVSATVHQPALVVTWYLTLARNQTC